MYRKKDIKSEEVFSSCKLLKIPIFEKYVVLHILEQLSCLPLKQISTSLVPSTIHCIIAFSPLCTSIFSKNSLSCFRLILNQDRYPACLHIPSSPRILGLLRKRVALI
uniref:Uncharacterized protein n=1 Tax=Micrurus lemniscatus lemniscatus TaxID=129467 RepID=A0A2D4JJC7_MICLE